MNTSRNPKDIATNLIKLLKNPSLRKNIGIAARHRIVSQHSSNTIAVQMVDIYQDVIKNAKHHY